MEKWLQAYKDIKSGRLLQISQWIWRTVPEQCQVLRKEETHLKSEFNFHLIYINFNKPTLPINFVFHLFILISSLKVTVAIQSGLFVQNENRQKNLSNTNEGHEMQVPSFFSPFHLILYN